MEKKFYGIAGTNGYGVYDDYEKVLKSRGYIKEYKVKSFKNLIDAKRYAVETYESLQDCPIRKSELVLLSESSKKTFCPDMSYDKA